MIILPSPPALWTFYDFGYLGGRTPIFDWYENEISDRARLSFDALVKNNQKIPNQLEWSSVDKQMQGILKGHQVWQWRIPGELQYRMLGVFHGLKKAVFLMGCYHKGRKYTPTDALGTTLERKKLLEKGDCKLHERPIKLDQ